MNKQIRVTLVRRQRLDRERLVRALAEAARLKLLQEQARNTASRSSEQASE